MGFENGNDSTGTIRTCLMGGVDEDGKVRAITVDSNGRLRSTGENTNITPDGSGVQRIPEIKKVNAFQALQTALGRQA